LAKTTSSFCSKNDPLPFKAFSRDQIEEGEEERAGVWVGKGAIMKKIELHCPCGASITLTDKRDTYINPSGAPDELGLVFIIDLQADRWQQNHAGHKSLLTAVHCLALSSRDCVIVEYEIGAISPSDRVALENLIRKCGANDVCSVQIMPGRGHLRFIKTSNQKEGGR